MKLYEYSNSDGTKGFKTEAGNDFPPESISELDRINDSFKKINSNLDKLAEYIKSNQK